MPVYAKGDRVASHVHDALGWPYSGVSRSAFHSHHASLVVLVFIQAKPKIGGRTSM